MATVALDSAALATITSAEPLFHARGLTKTYHMGEVDVHALQGVDLDLLKRYPGRVPRRVLGTLAMTASAVVGRLFGATVQ